MDRPDRRIRAVARASAPLRISLPGGGADLPDYKGRFGGEVIAMAVDLPLRWSVRAGGGAHAWSDLAVPSTVTRALPSWSVSG